MDPGGVTLHIAENGTKSEGFAFRSAGLLSVNLNGFTGTDVHIQSALHADADDADWSDIFDKDGNRATLTVAAGFVSATGAVGSAIAAHPALRFVAETAQAAARTFRCNFKRV